MVPTKVDSLQLLQEVSVSAAAVVGDAEVPGGRIRVTGRISGLHRKTLKTLPGLIRCFMWQYFYLTVLVFTQGTDSPQMGDLSVA